LTELITHDQVCCRTHDKNLADVVTSLDGILNEALFSRLLEQYENKPAREVYPENFE
jgi:hypothetical protein